MEFLDKKEQVLDTQLTQYGKYLLSLGRFEPVYYAFLDDDLIYDNKYTGLTFETQNQIHDRLKETPQLSSQYIFHGLETETSNTNKTIRLNENELISNEIKKIQPTPEKHYALSNPIGTMGLDSTNIPAWSVNVLNGQVSSSSIIQTGSLPNLSIPLLFMETVVYRTIPIANDTLVQIGNNSQVDDNSILGSLSDLSTLVQKFSDGSFINIYEDPIVIEIEELNSVFDNENFEIEFFKVENESFGGNVKEVLVPLLFNNFKKEIVKNNILLDEEEIRNLDSKVGTINTSNVEYFFDVFIDNEIDQNLLCGLANNRSQGLLDGQIVKCVTIKRDFENDLYKSTVTEEDLRDCN